MKVDEYECTLDYLDLSEANLMPLINEKAAMSDSQFIQKNYKFDMFLQIVLTTVNGITLKQTRDSKQGAVVSDDSENALISRNCFPIANLYFKCVHFDLPHSSNGFQHTQLTNHYQQIIVQELKTKIDSQLEYLRKNQKSDESISFVPYYDSIIDKKLRNNLGECKMSTLISSKVQQFRV